MEVCRRSRWWHGGRRCHKLCKRRQAEDWHCRALLSYLLRCRREYVLPDGLTDTWGHVRTEEEAAAAAAAAQQQRQGGPQLPKQPVLLVNNERFMVPEALFHPTGG